MDNNICMIHETPLNDNGECEECMLDLEMDDILEYYNENSDDFSAEDYGEISEDGDEYEY